MTFACNRKLFLEITTFWGQKSRNLEQFQSHDPIFLAISTYFPSLVTT